MKKIFAYILALVFSFPLMIPGAVGVFSCDDPLFGTALIILNFINVVIIIGVILNWVGKILDIKPYEL